MILWLCMAAFDGHAASQNDTELSIKSLLPFFGGGGVIPGVGIEVDTAIGKKNYFRVGGLLGAQFSVAGNGDSLLDLDLMLMPQYPIAKSSKYLVAYVSIPIGVTLRPLMNYAAIGMNLGFIPGVRYFFDDHWGILTELGFSYHTILTTRGNTSLPGGIWNLGAVFAF